MTDTASCIIINGHHLCLTIITIFSKYDTTAIIIAQATYATDTDKLQQILETSTAELHPTHFLVTKIWFERGGWYWILILCCSYSILSYTLGVDFKMAPHHKLGTATRPYAQVRRLWFDHWTSIILFIRDLDEKTLERKISLCREYLGVLDVIDAGISHNIGITAWWEDFFSLTNDNDLWRNCVWTFIQKFHTMLKLSLHAHCIDAISKD